MKLQVPATTGNGYEDKSMAYCPPTVAGHSSHEAVAFGQSIIRGSVCCSLYRNARMGMAAVFESGYGLGTEAVPGDHLRGKVISFGQSAVSVLASHQCQASFISNLKFQIGYMSFEKITSLSPYHHTFYANVIKELRFLKRILKRQIVRSL